MTAEESGFPWAFTAPQCAPERENVNVPIGTGRFLLYLAPELHQYVLYYPNEVLVVGLLGTHPILQPPADSSEAETSLGDRGRPGIIKCEFSGSLRALFDCTEVQTNNVSKKNGGSGKKKGEKKQLLSLPEAQPLCTFSLSDGSNVAIHPCIRGKSLEVLEINHRLLSQADLVRSIFHSSDEVPDFSGFLAIMTARKPDFVIRDHFAVSPLSILPISADVRRALTGDPNRPSITCKRPRTH